MAMFFCAETERMLPLYEGKMIHHFDHRFGDYATRAESRVDSVLPRTPNYAKSDPDFVTLPLYWVQEFDTLNEQKSKPGKPVYNLGVESRLEAKHWDRGWLLGWRDICRSTDERTMICGAVPRVGVGHKFPLCFTGEHRRICYWPLGRVSSLTM